MKLASDGIFKLGSLDKPFLQVNETHAAIAAFLMVPVHAVDRVVCRQFPIGLSSVIVDRPESAHAAIGYVGTVLLTNLVMFGGNPARIIAKLLQGHLLPIPKIRST